MLEEVVCSLLSASCLQRGLKRHLGQLAVHVAADAPAQQGQLSHVGGVAPGTRDLGPGISITGIGFPVSGFGIPGVGFRDSGFGIPGFGFRVSGFGRALAWI